MNTNSSNKQQATSNKQQAVELSKGSYYYF